MEASQYGTFGQLLPALIFFNIKCAELFINNLTVVRVVIQSEFHKVASRQRQQ